MRKVLFVVLVFNMILEGLTASRLISLPLLLEDFDPTIQGGYILYGFAAFSIAISIAWFSKYSDTESSLAFGLGILSTFHICLTIGCAMLSNTPGALGHGLLFLAFLFLFFNRVNCLPTVEDQKNF